MILVEYTDLIVLSDKDGKMILHLSKMRSILGIIRPILHMKTFFSFLFIFWLYPYSHTLREHNCSIFNIVHGNSLPISNFYKKTLYLENLPQKMEPQNGSHSS